MPTQLHKPFEPPLRPGRPGQPRHPPAAAGAGGGAFKGSDRREEGAAQSRDGALPCGGGEGARGARVPPVGRSRQGEGRGKASPPPSRDPAAHVTRHGGGGGEGARAPPPPGRAVPPRPPPPAPCAPEPLAAQPALRGVEPAGGGRRPWTEQHHGRQGVPHRLPQLRRGPAKG